MAAITRPLQLCMGVRCAPRVIHTTMLSVRTRAVWACLAAALALGTHANESQSGNSHADAVFKTVPEMLQFHYQGYVRSMAATCALAHAFTCGWMSNPRCPAGWAGLAGGFARVP